MKAVILWAVIGVGLGWMMHVYYEGIGPLGVLEIVGCVAVLVLQAVILGHRRLGENK